MSGRIGTAPCGHRGECVIGNYYRCLEGCGEVERDVARLQKNIEQAVKKALGAPPTPWSDGAIPILADAARKACERFQPPAAPAQPDRLRWTTVPDERQRVHRLVDSVPQPRYSFPNFPVMPRPPELRSLTFYDSAGWLMCRFLIPPSCDILDAEMWSLRGVACADGPAEYGIIFDDMARELVRMTVGPNGDIDWRHDFKRGVDYTIVLPNPFVKPW